MSTPDLVNGLGLPFQNLKFRVRAWDLSAFSRLHFSGFGILAGAGTCYLISWGPVDHVRDDSARRVVYLLFEFAKSCQWSIDTSLS